MWRCYDVVDSVMDCEKLKTIELKKPNLHSKHKLNSQILSEFQSSVVKPKPK